MTIADRPGTVLDDVPARAVLGPPAAPLAANRRTVLIGIQALVIAAASGVFRPETAQAANGVTLLMVDDPNCRYCRKFDAEVGRGYARTREGQFAPLVRVRRGDKALAGLNPAVYTPTFILVRRGEEIGRITGYPGATYFYSELSALLGKIGYMPGYSTTPSAT